VINFPGLLSLERLCLCTYTRSFDNSDENRVRYPLITITQILQNLSSIKHLTLTICLRFQGKDITRVDWSPLANFLFNGISILIGRIEALQFFIRVKHYLVVFAVDEGDCNVFERELSLADRSNQFGRVSKVTRRIKPVYLEP